MRFLIVIFICCVGIITVAHSGVFVPSNLETTIRQTFEINLENRYKGLIHKCEKEGISEIRALNSPFEEFWAFFPGKCAWIELGILEQIGGTLRRDKDGKCKSPNTISGIKKADVIALMKEATSLTLFHPHPTNKKLVEYLQGTAGLEKFSKSCISEASTETLASALPSVPDLTSMFIFSRLFYQEERAHKFLEKLISAYGVTEYGLTKKGLKVLQSTNFEKLRREDIGKYLGIRNRLTPKDYLDERSLPLNRKKLASIIKHINDGVTLFYLIVE